MIDFSKPRMTKIYQVKKGRVFFVCSCGKLSSVTLKEYNRKCRCKDCETYNTLLTSRLYHLGLDREDLAELFNIVYENGLSDYLGVTND